ncbi:MAG TPA: glutathione S-transferase [Polyangiaceae bacterium]|jgi:glutathione S-transferase|nr:glutathione S-transferase [Polyangiaceae bacterium]
MEKPSRPIRLYRHPLSGHAHRAELFLSILGLPFERIDVDLAKAEQKSPDFLARNPFGQVPVIEDGDVTLPESNAILVYLANRYDPTGRWHPREARAAAEVQRWLSIASGPLHAGPATARLVHVFGAKLDLPRAQAVAAQLFTIIDRHLARRMFLAGSDAPTVADVALYSYTAHAPEGGVSLSPYDHVRAWLGRVEALPGFVPMCASPLPTPIVA